MQKYLRIQIRETYFLSFFYSGHIFFVFLRTNDANAIICNPTEKNKAGQKIKHETCEGFYQLDIGDTVYFLKNRVDRR